MNKQLPQIGPEAIRKKLSPNLAGEMGLDLARSVFAFAGDAGELAAPPGRCAAPRLRAPGLLQPVTQKAQINPSLSLSGWGAGATALPSPNARPDDGRVTDSRRSRVAIVMSRPARRGTPANNSLSNACDEAPDGLLTASVLERHGQAQRAETAWVVSQPGSIAVAALLSPVLAFLIAIAVEILIGALMDAGVLPLFALVAAGTIGGSQFRRQRVRPRGATVET